MLLSNHKARTSPISFRLSRLLALRPLADVNLRCHPLLKSSSFFRSPPPKTLAWLSHGKCILSKSTRTNTTWHYVPKNRVRVVSYNGHSRSGKLIFRFWGYQSQSRIASLYVCKGMLITWHKMENKRGRKINLLLGICYDLHCRRVLVFVGDVSLARSQSGDLLVMSFLLQIGLYPSFDHSVHLAVSKVYFV